MLGVIKNSILRLKPRKSKIWVLTYHGLVEKIEHDRLQRNFHTIHQFEEQIKFLIENNYYFLSIDEMISYFDNRIDICGDKNVLITFDDGYRNNKSAIEILNKYQLPGVFFLSSGVIATGKTIWTVEFSMLLLEGSLSKLVLNDNIFDIVTKKQKEHVFSELRVWLKTISSEERVKYVNCILEQYPDGILDELHEKYSCFQMLNWNEIRELKSDKISFQSHGHLHEIHNANQSFESLLFEIQTSKQILEKELSQDCVAFAFPNGNWNSLSVEFLEKIGYKLAFQLNNKPSVMGESRFSISRITPNTKLVKFISQFK